MALAVSLVNSARRRRGDVVVERALHAYHRLGHRRLFHCKPILALGSDVGLLRAARLGPALDAGRHAPGLIIETSSAAGANALMAALAAPRSFERETDPPLV